MESRRRAIEVQYQEDLRVASDPAVPPDKRAKMISEAENRRAEALAKLKQEPGTAPQRPAGDETPLTPPSGAAQGSNLGETLKALANFQALRGDGPAPTLSNRGAIITAAGDVATEYIFSQLADPTVAGSFRGKKVLFGVSMVSVNPGWRTKKGYAADIAVTCQYSYQPARRQVVQRFIEDPLVAPEVRARIADSYGLPRPADIPADIVPLAVNGPIPEPLRLPTLDSIGIPTESGAPTPVVAAVSPMTETQALGLASSARRQDEYAISLAFALRYLRLGAQAEAFERFVRQRQQDVATATTNVAVNAYSYGSMYGFQVGPRLVAVERVRSGKAAGPAAVLERQSFPVLILYGLERQELVRLAWSQPGNRLEVHEAKLALLGAPNWMPIVTGAAQHRLTEWERLHWSESLKRELGSLPTSMTTPEGAAAWLAKWRAYALRFKAFGGGVIIDLPEEVFSEDLQEAEGDGGPGDGGAGGGGGNGRNPPPPQR